MAVALVAALAAASPSEATAAHAGGWLRVDTHLHSVWSGDGLPDLGILAEAASARGYDAVFVTDHAAGANGTTSSIVANHPRFDDEISKWDFEQYGELDGFTAELAASPVNTGTASMHLAATTAGEGEIMAELKRGPVLRFGDIILEFAVYPTRIDPGSSVYVSVAIGGDETVDPPNGYTTAAGVVSPGKSTILVWQLGTGMEPASDPNARVLTYDLGGYTLNAWNHYTINITDAIADIPVADRPLDVNALQRLKMAVRAIGGTAEAYFDSYVMDQTVPELDADAFVNRTSYFGAYDTPAFRMFPALEVGFGDHTNNFDFGITDPGQFSQPRRGTNEITNMQLNGYPAQLNHPGLPGGVNEQELTDNLGYGADLLEVRPEPAQADEIMIDLWDLLLQQGVVMTGTWGSDAHRTDSLDKPMRGVATSVYATALAKDSILQALYEGRASLVRRTNPGELVFTLDPDRHEPYPARYPVFIPAGSTSEAVYLEITDGLNPGDTVVWVVDGVEAHTDPTSGPSYDDGYVVDVSGSARTYVRAQVRDATGTIVAMTQPIFFVDVPGLTAGRRLHVDRVTTPTGRNYNRLFVQGISQTSWNAVEDISWLTLENPAGSIVDVRHESPAPPGRILLDGAVISEFPSLAAYEDATTPGWFYDSARSMLHIKAIHAMPEANVLTEFGAPDTTAPSAPPNVSAVPASHVAVDVAWDTASDDTGVIGYTVYRDTVPATNRIAVATVAAEVTSIEDAGLQPDTEYRYEVVASDPYLNVGPPGGPATVTTLPAPSSLTFIAVADTYVSESAPTTNFGTSSKLRVDASPHIESFTKFDVTGVVGSVTTATLRVWSTSSSSRGFEVGAVTDVSWVETSLVWANRPTIDPPISSSGGFAAGEWVEVDVTPLVSGDGDVSIGLTALSTTALSVSAREGTNPPELHVAIDTPANAAPSAADVAAQTFEGIPTTVRLAASDPDGDCPLEFAIVDSPSSGSVGPIQGAQCAVGTATADVTYTPDPGFEGMDSFTYRATDPEGAVSNLATASITVDPAPGALTFIASADTYVKETMPNRNYGRANKLRADTSPWIESFVKFDVSGVGGSVTSATLRVFSTSVSPTGFDLGHVADVSWQETGMTWLDRPSIEPPIATSGGFASGQWIEVDVTPLVTGDGQVSFGLTGLATRALSVSSREGINPPELIVTLGP